VTTCRGQDAARARVLSLAFVFLLVATAPRSVSRLHNCCDAHARPTPISRFCRPVAQRAIYAVVRCKCCRGSLHSALPSNMLMDSDCCRWSWRRCPVAPADIKRLFAYSSIEHMGSSVSPSAWRCGRDLRRASAHDVHSLTKSAIFFTVGHARRSGIPVDGRHTRTGVDQSRHRMGLMIGSLAILACRPSASLRASFSFSPPPCGSSPGHAHFAARARDRLCGDLATGATHGIRETTARRLPHPPALLPVFVHLGSFSCSACGSAVPGGWYRAAANLIGGP